MNPYHEVVVAQHRHSLLLVAHSARAGAARVQRGERDGLRARLRDAAIGVWSLAAAAPPAMPTLRDYPGANAI